MIEKIKEVPFIIESSAVRICSFPNGKVVLERSDRVVWAYEFTSFHAQPGIDCFVEAKKFFALFQEIASLEQTTCLKVTLKNGAVYELPFIDTSWESQDMPVNYSQQIAFNLSELKLCTLKNLIKPDLQCIYIDQIGAVSCDYVSACISSAVKSNQPLLLPPDVQELVDGTICSLEVADGKIFLKHKEGLFGITTMNPQLPEDKWWEALRDMIASYEGTYTSAKTLATSVKRLAMFGDYISFTSDKAYVGTNFEPFTFKEIANKSYEIAQIDKILMIADTIAESSNNLLFTSTNSNFLISPLDDEEETTDENI